MSIVNNRVSSAAIFSADVKAVSEALQRVERAREQRSRTPSQGGAASNTQGKTSDRPASGNRNK